MAAIVSCITEPATEIGKCIGERILNQLAFLWDFDTNIKSLRDEARVLDGATKGLQLEVDQATDTVDDIDPEVVTWIEMSKDIQAEASRILDEASIVESHRWKVIDRSSVSKRAKEMTERLKNHRATKRDSVRTHSRPAAATRIDPREETFKCESRNKIEEEIMTTLRDVDKKMIGLYGMGGLGKTTMAKKLMNRALNEHIFDEVVIVTVSQNVDILKIQDEIGRQLKLEKLKDKNLEQTERVDLLQCRLLQSKRTLLVLDDVWERLELEDFGIPRGSEWCTILFTSRNRDDLCKMGVKILFGMEVLSEEEAWSFFRERAGSCVDDRVVNPIAQKVVKECGRLPLALDVVGVGLRDQPDAGTWENALLELQQRVPDTVQFDNKMVYNPLKLSYKGLDSEAAKSIFLLCCLFPEDADIPLDYLTNFGMGLRLFERITNMRAARSKVCALTGKLKDRSLLLKGHREDCVRMHDLIRDVCILIAEEEGYIGKHGGRWISSSHLVEETKELLSESRRPNIQLLLFDSRYDSSGFKFDDAFLEGMRELRVLCIERYSLTKLPRTTQPLGNLHTLILESCKELKSISAVGEMVNLEILICRDCYSIEELPSEMKGLKSLKVLDLTRCRKLQRIGRGIISSLVALEELKMLKSFNGWEAGYDDVVERENAGAQLRELEDLPNLACLEIENPPLHAENMALSLNRYRICTNEYVYVPFKFSKEMSLRLGRKDHLGDWIERQFLRDTEYLRLRGEGANNVDLAKIHQNIRWLKLEECESMKNVVRTSGGSDDATVLFPSLEHLELQFLPDLQEICDGPISSTSFHNLKELKLSCLRALTQLWKSSRYVPHFSNLSSIDIGYCDSLRNLGQLSIVKDCLPHLEELKISNCTMMEKVFLWNDMEEAIESHVITKVFPKLKKVELDYLPNLTTFYQGIQGIKFPLLMEMVIIDCPQMKSIIGSGSADIDEDVQKHRTQLLVSAPNLRIVKIDYKEIDATEDLNGALHQHYLARQEEIFRHTELYIEYNSMVMQFLHRYLMDWNF